MGANLWRLQVEVINNMEAFIVPPSIPVVSCTVHVEGAAGIVVIVWSAEFQSIQR